MPADLDRDPLLLLNLVSRLLRIQTDKRAREHGMTRAQWIILVRVAKEPGLTQQALADILEVEPISVGRLVDKLEERGFVERRRDPKDRRVWRLHNLPAAEPVVRIVNDARMEFNSMITANIGAKKITELVDTLLAIKNNLSEDRGASGSPNRNSSNS
jgi:Transcriptional regulators